MLSWVDIIDNRVGTIPGIKVGYMMVAKLIENTLTMTKSIRTRLMKAYRHLLSSHLEVT